MHVEEPTNAGEVRALLRVAGIGRIEDAGNQLIDQAERLAHAALSMLASAGA